MSSLLGAQRRRQILDLLDAQGAVRAQAVADQLEVSVMTVRRDIAHLAERGLCVKVHGGAAKGGQAAQEPGFLAKADQAVETKQALAKVAAALVQPGQAVGISAGTTTFWVAAELASRAAADGITVVTNSLPATEPFAAHGAAANCLLTGGVRTPSQALVGPAAEATLSSLQLDWLFLGVHGISLKGGLTTPNMAEAATNQALIRAANRTVVVADSSKWGLTGLVRIAPIETAANLITDSGLPAAGARQLRQRTELVLVPVPAGASLSEKDPAR